MRLLSDEELALRMGRNSLRMSYQFDPQLWAEMLLTHVSNGSTVPPVPAHVARE